MLTSEEEGQDDILDRLPAMKESFCNWFYSNPSTIAWSALRDHDTWLGTVDISKMTEDVVFQLNALELVTINYRIGQTGALGICDDFDQSGITITPTYRLSLTNPIVQEIPSEFNGGAFKFDADTLELTVSKDNLFFVDGIPYNTDVSPNLEFHLYGDDGLDSYFVASFEYLSEDLSTYCNRDEVKLTIINEDELIAL